MSDLDKAVDNIKKVIAQEVTLSYFNVSQSVVIQTDVSSLGLGSCLLQNGKPIAYHFSWMSSVLHKVQSAV